MPCPLSSIRVLLVKTAAALTLLAMLLLSAGTAHAQPSIVIEGQIDAAPSAVWEAWTTSAGLRAWLAPHAEIDLRIDGLMRVNYSPQGALGDPNTIENRILSFDPQRMLSIRVARAPDNFPFRARVIGLWTVLHFQAAAPGKTLLRIVTLGFETDEESQKMRAFFERGNAFTLQQVQKRFPL